MARPLKFRRVFSAPRIYYFKPGSVPLCGLEEIVLQPDEFQAIKSSDLEHKDQATGALAMGISRQTFGNILASARGKLAYAVVNGKAIKITGGPAASKLRANGGQVNGISK